MAKAIKKAGFSASLQPVPQETNAVTVSSSVAVSIIEKAVSRHSETACFPDASIFSNIAEIIGSKAGHDRSVSVKIDGMNIEIELHLIMKYGIFIPDAVKALCSDIEKDLADMADITVKKITVDVEDVYVPEEPEQEK